MYVCVYVCMYVCMQVCMYVYMYVCIYVYMFICLYVYMYICIYVCICMLGCMHCAILSISLLCMYIFNIFMYALGGRLAYYIQSQVHTELPIIIVLASIDNRCPSFQLSHIPAMHIMNLFQDFCFTSSPPSRLNFFNEYTGHTLSVGRPDGEGKDWSYGLVSRSYRE